MPAERFFVDAPLQDRVIISGLEFHHLAHVMRLKVGEQVELVNGKGDLASGTVLSLSKKEAIVEVLSLTHQDLPPPRFLLAIPIMRPSKLELVIEKCTELGADAFWIYPASHSDKETLSPHQQERLKSIAISAMKQCGRLDLPPIEILDTFAALFQTGYTYLFGDPKAKESAHPTETKTVFITGPEKGFSQKEYALLAKHGRGVLLHKNVLRAETAPIAAITRLCIPDPDGDRA